MTKKYAELSVCSDADDSDPEYVTRLLGLTPTLSWKKGTEYQRKCYDADSKTWGTTPEVHSRTVWRYSTEFNVPTQKMDDHIEFLLDALTLRRAQIEALLNEKERYWVSVGLWRENRCGHDSVALSREWLREFAGLCHDLWVTYIHLEDEEGGEE
ncbi:DUF4279 domain-containing protein [bacterium]|nr:DUF4279 domain-containing protein [bacterium]